LRGARTGEVDRDERATTGLGAIPIAFDALLKTVQVAVPRGSLRESGGKTAASQMFEPPSANPHERRQTVLQADHQSTARDAKYAPTDQTDVDARLTSHADRNNATSGRPIADRFGVSRHAATSSAGATSRSGMDGVTHGDPIQPSQGQGSDAPVKIGGTDQRSTDPMNVVTPPPPTGTASTSTGTASATGAIRAVDAAAGAKASSPAHQLATLLGGARGGEVESGRAVSPTPGDGRSSGGQQSSAQRSLVDSRPGEESGAARSSRESDRAGETGRSKFDELVRSIRLHATPRHSSARMQLQPPELGRISVDLRVEGDQVRITVRAETGDARTLLAERADQLKAALEQHGITVQKFEVSLETAAQHPYSASNHAESALDDQMAGRGGGDEQGSTRTGYDEVTHDDRGDSPDRNEMETTAPVAGSVGGPVGIDIRI
jgi:flagellar hook-length control protein FliK